MTTRVADVEQAHTEALRINPRGVVTNNATKTPATVAYAQQRAEYNQITIVGKYWHNTMTDEVSYAWQEDLTHVYFVNAGMKSVVTKEAFGIFWKPVTGS